MPGRGRQCRAKCADTKCVKTNEKNPTRAGGNNPGSLPRCPGEAFKEEEQNGGTTTKVQTPKKREQKKINHSTPREKTTKHFTEEIGMQQKTPTDGSPVTKDKTCPGRWDSTTTDPVKIAKPNKQFRKENKTLPEIPEGTKKASPKTKRAQPCCGETKSPEQIAKEIKNTQESSKQDKCTDEAEVNTLLNKTLNKLKIKKLQRSDAAKVINEIVENIMKDLRKNSQYFKEVENPLHTGSYYENLKISNPDEFDVMLPIPVDRVAIEPYGDNGAFYSVTLKRGKSPLIKFQQGTHILSASEMLKQFRDEVKNCVKTFKVRIKSGNITSFHDSSSFKKQESMVQKKLLNSVSTEWVVTKKKKGCPAVTLTTEVNSVTISLDLVLCLEVKSSWPAFTNDGFKVEGWLGTKVKKDKKYKPYYLVPKYEGSGTAENDGVLAKDVWRVSFSHIEKDILMNHGSEKTCCEAAGARCCRKDCLKLLKHLLSLLKEAYSFDKFCSYHAKTTLLHACCSRTKDTDWPTQRLSHCFKQLLEDFEGHLEKGELCNFFIPTQNLLSGLSREKCRNLARHIRDERNNGFPIFQ